MNFLYVLYLPPYPPSIFYRPWGLDGNGFSPLRWQLERMVRRYGTESLVIACQDATDCRLAESLSLDLGVFVALVGGRTMLEALGELAAIFPHSPIAYVRPEALFAPCDLLDRMCAHHELHRNDFTYAAGVPPLLGPEVANPALLAALARLLYDADPPAPRGAVLTLAEIRQASSVADPIRAEPFDARSCYAVPDLQKVTPFQTRADVERARQSVEGLPEEHGFGAVSRWLAASFDPPEFDWSGMSDGAAPKLLYLSPASLYSGGEECLRGLAEGMAGLGFRQAAVVGFEGVLTARLRDLGCHTMAANWDYCGYRDVAGPIRDDETNRRFAERVLDQVSPDYVHCNSDPGAYFTRGALARGLPVVFHVRANSFDKTVELIEESSHLICVSGFVKRRLIHAGVSPAKITVVYDGINPQWFSRLHFDKIAMRRRFDLPEDALVILMVARPYQQKRHDVMLDALFELSRDVTCARLVFVTDVGPSAWVSAMRRRILELNLQSIVRWLPFQEDIRQIESASDMVVLPSDEEPLGTCILEGMSLELPVVVSDSGGTHELIEDGVSGLSFRGGDAAALARTLRRLAESEDLRTALGRRKAGGVEERLTLRHHAEQVVGVLNALRR